ncbi:MAG: peptide deformylase [Rhodospirillales bacterium]|nr:peptide deformylase [Rhodospirillales bacterium]
MALLPILTAPDPRLKKKSLPVEKVDDEIKQLMKDMLETMYDAPGIGLAAAQVGVLKRVLVIDITKDEENEAAPLCMANPEIIWASDEKTVYEEGCLSVPEQFAEVKRPEKVKVRFIDQENEIREIEVDGLLATCVQHEMDHLEGVLFVDHLSTVKRGMMLRKAKKSKKLSM